MFDKKTALDCVSKILVEKTPPDQTWAIVETQTRETASAWIFFYNAQRYLDTGNVIGKLAGNGRLPAGVTAVASLPISLW